MYVSYKVRETLGEHPECIRRLIAELGHDMNLRFDNLIEL